MLGKKLKRTLEKLSESNRAFGGGGTVDREKLREELYRINHGTRMTFIVAAVMTAIVFVLLVTLAVLYRESVGVLTGIMSALGITITGSISTMRGLARDMAQTNLIVALSGELTGEDMKHVIDALIISSSGKR